MRRTPTVAGFFRLPALDPKGLSRVVHQWHRTSCGVVPTTVDLPAGQELGAITATLVRYMTSGDVSGDLHTVAGYTGRCTA